MLVYPYTLFDSYFMYFCFPISGNGKIQNDRFTSSAAYISSVYNSPPVNPNAANKNLLPDYSKYLKRWERFLSHLVHNVKMPSFWWLVMLKQHWLCEPAQWTHDIEMVSYW